MNEGLEIRGKIHDFGKKYDAIKILTINCHRLLLCREQDLQYVPRESVSSIFITTDERWKIIMQFNSVLFLYFPSEELQVQLHEDRSFDIISTTQTLIITLQRKRSWKTKQEDQFRNEYIE